MIVPNLRVADVARSIAFYRDVLGFELRMTVAADRSFGMGAQADPATAVFATLALGESELMLQSVASLEQDLPGLFPKGSTPPFGGTVYLRGHDPRAVAERLDPTHLVRGPEGSWYGMLELYLRDPDGHVICVGMPEGPPPS